MRSHFINYDVCINTKYSFAAGIKSTAGHGNGWF